MVTLGFLNHSRRRARSRRWSSSLLRAVLAALVAAQSVAAAPRPPVSPAVPSPLRVALERHAAVRLFAPPTGGPLVYLVKDVHLNAEAAGRVAETIKTIARGRHRITVGIEGSWGGYDFSPVLALDRDDVRRRIAADLFQHHRIGPAAFAAISDAALGRRLRVVGIDDPALYRTNVAALQAAHARRASALKRLAAFADGLEPARARAATFLSARKKYRSGALRLPGYLGVMEELAPGVAQPNAIADYRRLLADEEALDERRLRADMGSLFDAVTGPPLRRITQDLSGDAPLPSQARAYASLLRLADAQGLTDAPERIRLSAYARYLSRAARFDARALRAAVGVYERAVLSSLDLDAANVQAVYVADATYLAHRLVRFELSPDEWRRYHNRVGALDADMRRALRPFERFYEAAEARDAALARRFADHAPEGGILLAGGFHADRIAARLHADGFDVVFVTPRVTRLDSGDGAAYLSSFVGAHLRQADVFGDRALFLALPEPLGAKQTLPLIAPRNVDLARFARLYDEEAGEREARRRLAPWRFKEIARQQLMFLWPVAAFQFGRLAADIVPGAPAWLPLGAAAAAFWPVLKAFIRAHETVIPIFALAFRTSPERVRLALRAHATILATVSVGAGWAAQAALLGIATGGTTFVYDVAVILAALAAAFSTGAASHAVQNVLSPVPASTLFSPTSVKDGTRFGINVMDETARIATRRMVYGGTLEPVRQMIRELSTLGVRTVYLYGGLSEIGSISKAVHTVDTPDQWVLPSDAVLDDPNRRNGLDGTTFVEIQRYGTRKAAMPRQIPLRDQHGNAFAVHSLLRPNPRLGPNADDEIRQTIAFARGLGVEVYEDVFIWLDPSAVTADPAQPGYYKNTFYKEMSEISPRMERLWAAAKGRPNLERFLIRRWLTDTDGRFFNANDRYKFAVKIIEENGKRRPIFVRHLTNWGINKDQIVLNIFKPAVQDYFFDVMKQRIDRGSAGGRVDLGFLLLRAHHRQFATRPGDIPPGTSEPLKDAVDRARSYARSRGRDFRAVIETYDWESRDLFLSWPGFASYYKDVADNYDMHQDPARRERDRVSDLREAIRYAIKKSPDLWIFPSNYDEESLRNTGGPVRTFLALHTFLARAGVSSFLIEREGRFHSGNIFNIVGPSHPNPTREEFLERLTRTDREILSESPFARYARIIPALDARTPLEILDTSMQHRYIAIAGKSGNRFGRWLIHVADFESTWEDRNADDPMWVHVPTAFLKENRIYGLAPEKQIAYLARRFEMRNVATGEVIPLSDANLHPGSGETPVRVSLPLANRDDLNLFRLDPISELSQFARLIEAFNETIRRALYVMFIVAGPGLAAGSTLQGPDPAPIRPEPAGVANFNARPATDTLLRGRPPRVSPLPSRRAGIRRAAGSA